MEEYCVVCGEPIDYCQGHGDVADYERLWDDHDFGDHSKCHPDANCER